MRLTLQLRQIKFILQKPDAVAVIELFQQNIDDLDDEIAALSTIRSVLVPVKERT